MKIIKTRADIEKLVKKEGDRFIISESFSIGGIKLLIEKGASVNFSKDDVFEVGGVNISLFL